MNAYWALILLWHFLNVRSVNAREIEWLPTSPYYIKNITSNGIFCHAGTPKTIWKLWWTLQIHVKVISGEVTLYSGGSPKAVFDNYEGFIEAGSKLHVLTSSINPFNTACVAVNFTTKNSGMLFITQNSDKQHGNHSKYEIKVLLTSVDLWRVKVMASGMIVIFASTFLSRNPIVFYLCVSILVPIFLFVPILYYVCQRSVTHCLVNGTLLIACVTFLDRHFHTYYVLVTGIIGFLVAYRIGPPDHPRSKNIIMWIFQSVGVIMIRWSTWYEEASIFIAIFALGITYILLFIRKRNEKHLALPLPM